MRKEILFTLDTPYREPLELTAAAFGDPDAAPCCAVVGSMRGNEVQQTFICAALVKRLQELEEAGLFHEDKRVLVVPCVNAFSMNIHKRFWPVDNTDINRMFPGYDAGETTQRIADGLFRAVMGFPYGVQLASFYLRGQFVPHVRITNEGYLSTESLEMADLFGLPATLLREPSSFDTTTLNYNWQVWDTHAFSVYSRATGSIDVESAYEARDGIVRFLVRIGALDEGALGGIGGIGGPGMRVVEEELVKVRPEEAGGFFKPAVRPGDRVVRGQELASVLDTFDNHVKEVLEAPVDGTVFFMRSAPVVNQYSISFMVAPEKGTEGR